MARLERHPYLYLDSWQWDAQLHHIVEFIARMMANNEDAYELIYAELPITDPEIDPF